MADILTFPHDAGTPEDELSTVENDMFLKDEGLELLAAYRAIRDPSVRSSVMHLVKTLAARGAFGTANK